MSDGTFYKGLTNNLDRRLEEHDKGKTISNRVKRPFKLIHVELEEGLESAKKLELYFKSGFGREIIRELDSY